MNSQKNIIDKIKDVIMKISPSLQAHGGDLEFVDFDKKTAVVKVKMQGQCIGCPMAQVTLQEGIEKEIKREVPEVKKVVAV